MKERLIELRKRSGLSQEELAIKLLTTRQAVSKWERGESMPSTENLIELARFYGVSMDYIAGKRHSPDSSSAPPKKRGFWLDEIYTLFITLVYLILGVVWGLWHVGWVLFLTIPIYQKIGQGRE